MLEVEKHHQAAKPFHHFLAYLHNRNSCIYIQVSTEQSEHQDGDDNVDADDGCDNERHSAFCRAALLHHYEEHDRN